MHICIPMHICIHWEIMFVAYRINFTKQIVLSICWTFVDILAFS